MNIWNLRGVTSGAIRNISDAGNIEMAGAAADKQLGEILPGIVCGGLCYICILFVYFLIDLVIYGKLRYNKKRSDFL